MVKSKDYKFRESAKILEKRKYDTTFDDEKHKMKKRYRGQDNRKTAKIKREKDASLLY